MPRWLKHYSRMGAQAAPRWKKRTMTSGDNDTGLNPIDLEALRWALLMESGPLSPEDQRQLDAWVAESSRHQGALVRARAASLYLDRLGTFARGRSVVEAPPSSRRVSRRWVVFAA